MASSSPTQSLNKSNHGSPPGPLKVLFLSSDTGGGHRASAESLAAQFELLFPGSSYNLLDVMTKDGLPPYNRMVESYKHLSAHPKQWNLVFKFSNSRAFEFFFDVSNKLLCEKAMRKSIREYDPDVVVSVHPLMTNVPVMCCEKISKETGRHLPIFTVVTDLASAHCLWFANGVDKLYIASDECRKLAKVRGKVPDEKIVEIGLPIRHQFAVQADKLGDRTSEEGKQYQISLRTELNLPVVDKKTVLVMGGGEGVGSLSNIVDALYVEFSNQGIDALILVVCGRNEKLKQSLETRDWDGVIIHHQQEKLRPSRSLLSFSACSAPPPPATSPSLIDDKTITTTATTTSNKSTIAMAVGCMDGTVTQQIQRILSTSSLSKVNALGEMKLVDSEDVEVSVAPADGSSISDGDGNSTVSQPPPTIEGSDTSVNVNPESMASISKSLLPSMRPPTAPTKNRASPTSESQPSPSMSLEPEKRGDVTVVGLGFVTKMAEYMVAADILVSKAGPGTIAEAASLSLPVMLTSFLPGQEEGNVDFVVNGNFGAFISDKDPPGIAEEVGNWLLDEEKATTLSKNAKKCGAPHAARDIVKSIGRITHKWKKINDDRNRLEEEVKRLRTGQLSKDEDDEFFQINGDDNVEVISPSSSS